MEMKELSIWEDIYNSSVFKKTTEGRELVLLYRAVHMSQYLLH